MRHARSFKNLIYIIFQHALFWNSKHRTIWRRTCSWCPWRIRMLCFTSR